MPSFFHIIWTILSKDLRSERRSKEFIAVTASFGLLMLVIFNFAFTAIDQRDELGAGILWIAFSFAGTLGLNRIFSGEMQNGNFQALQMAPVDKEAIYFGKFLSAAIFMLLAECMLLPLYALFFNPSSSTGWLGVMTICMLGTLGYIGAGVIFSALAANSRLKDTILPVLLFPISIPLLIASVEATAVFFQGSSWNGAWDWIKIIVVYDLVVIVLGALCFEFILEE